MNLHELRQEYEKGAFLEELAGSNPFLLFNQWFEEAKSSGTLEPNAFALSTIDEQGFPDCRVVLLKEVWEERFVFYTNYSSAKGKQLQLNPSCTLVFWWESVQRQVRIKGKAEKVSEEMSKSYFKVRPKGSQIGAIASEQSHRLTSRKEMEERFRTLTMLYKDGVEPEKPMDWGGYSIQPHYFEFWQGQRSRMHDRIVFEYQENTWQKFRLWP